MEHFFKEDEALLKKLRKDYENKDVEFLCVTRTGVGMNCKALSMPLLLANMIEACLKNDETGFVRFKIEEILKNTEKAE